MATAEKVLNALRSYDLRDEGGGKWRCNSPLRPGSNSHAFCLVIDDEEHGAYDDKVSGDSGSLYDIAAKLGIETPSTRTPVANTKRPYQNIADYAAAHGVTAEYLTSNGWSEVVFQDRRALSFKTATGLRYRFIDGDGSYKSQVGYKSCWYGLQRAVKMARDLETALVLCNGEISTLAAQHRGIPACAFTGGERELPITLLKELREAWDGAIWLAYDCDNTGRAAAAKIAVQLPRAVVVDLKLGDKGDLADFVMLHGDEAFAQLREIAVEAPKVEAQMTDAELLSSALKQLAQAVRQDEQSAVDVGTALAQAQAQLDRMTMRLAKPVMKSFGDLAQEQLAMAAEREEIALNGESPFAVEGMRSNFEALDRAIGGFRSELYVVYGATGMGKTFCVVSFAREFLKQAPGFIVSTEMQPGRWFNRLVASMAQVPTSTIRKGTYASRDEWARVKQAYELLGSMNCHILDHASPTPALVRAAVLEGMDKGYGYEWMIIDSASKMEYPGSASIYDTTRGVSNGLQNLYRELDIPIVITTQIGRDVAARPPGKKNPQLEDAYGGGVIEHNAGCVLGLYNHSYYVKRGLEVDRPDLPEGVVTAQLLKSRDEDDSEAPSFRLQLVGGAGFYEYKPEILDLNAIAYGTVRVQ